MPFSRHHFGLWGIRTQAIRTSAIMKIFYKPKVLQSRISIKCVTNTGKGKVLGHLHTLHDALIKCLQQVMFGGRKSASRYSSSYIRDYPGIFLGYCFVSCIKHWQSQSKNKMAMIQATDRATRQHTFAFVLRDMEIADFEYLIM